MAETIFKVPPQCGHCSMSIPNRAQLMRTGVVGRGVVLPLRYAARPGISLSSFPIRRSACHRS